MRILLLSILLVSINILFAQEINYSIEFGPTIPLNMWNITKINYATNNSNQENIYSYKNKIYKRNWSIGFSAKIIASVNYKILKKYDLICGLSFDYFYNKLCTSLSSSKFCVALAPDNTIILGRTMKYTFHPIGTDGLITDENGIPIFAKEADYKKYKIKEKIHAFYMSIPIKLGVVINEKVNMSFGGVTSIMLYTNLATKYPYNLATIFPYEENRIFENNISTFREIFFSVQCGLSYKVSQKILLSTVLQQPIVNMVKINSVYNVTDRSRIRNISLGIIYLITKK